MQIQSLIKEKLWPFLAGLGSASIMFLSFFVPSIQDQLDRREARKIINQYEALGNDFYTEEKYDLAEQAYQKAFELSDSKRLDLEVKRLEAKINRINMNPRWGAAPPEDLEDVDFQYVLLMEKGKDKAAERKATLNSYGVFLAASKKPKQAYQAFEEAIQIDSTDELAYVNLGNLNDQQGRKSEAIKNYLRAISIDNSNSTAHYNLGLLYYEQGRLEESLHELQEAMKIDPSDPEITKQYQFVRAEIQKR